MNFESELVFFAIEFDGCHSLSGSGIKVSRTRRQFTLQVIHFSVAAAAMVARRSFNDQLSVNKQSAKPERADEKVVIAGWEFHHAAGSKDERVTTIDSQGF